MQRIRRFLAKTYGIRGFFPETEEYMEAEERLSYLYMSRLQAEDPHSERKRPDRRSGVSQVRKDVYKEKVDGRRAVRRDAENEGV